MKLLWDNNLNLEKTSLFFSHNTPQATQDEIKNRFGAEIIKEHEKYLGLPSLVGKNKCNTFHQLLERLDNKLSRWKEKLLSNAEKEILIKTVAQVVSIYIMSVFKLPNALCDDMTSMVRKFFFGGGGEGWWQANEKNKMAWLSWDKTSYQPNWVTVHLLLGVVLWQSGPAQGLGKLGLSLRLHQKTKISLGKNAPLSIVKMPKFYKIIYIF